MPRSCPPPSHMKIPLGLRNAATTAVVLALAACSGSPEEPKAPPQAAGQLTSSEPLPAADALSEAGTSLRITYLSTDGVTGSGLVPVTGEVFIPSGAPPAGGWPIVAWAHGTVGVADSCAPSQNPVTPRNQAYLSAWLQRGFAIVATDYQGLGTPGPHPYLNARAEAYSVLDSVRAALSGVKGLSNKVMIVGQSQGAGAAFAAAAYAPVYAPTLGVKGTVATGIPYMSPQIVQAMLANITKAQHVKSKAAKGGHGKVAPSGEGDPTVVYALLLGASQAALDPGFKPETAFTPAAMPSFQAASQMCIDPLFKQVGAAGLTPATAFTPGFAQALAPTFRAMAYPTLKLAQPVFIGTGTADKDVSPASQLALVHDACAAGSTVQAHLYKGLAHSPTLLASLKDSAAFTEAVMNDRPVVAECTPTPK
ncbi:hypothetical protein AA23498_1554 [Acetobacter nitrogenifigens DSM 23921 = NBRC 105050]|uniref:Lipase n=2 Tax=Acetobacter nitrogenifigens TaxID=285268 RepID=A0A511XB16_9PROT|nr:lipase family protein [Acetobacter nitrogenifigens]GBQ92804.1 hypothetical protein AA23498_1554 [Acetobacter nitrogenifigens DSM 23921 = NBRC 105050]GEN60136.1 lipase [Acetobacter nitrogenifigens DSM 23921 = NBRC 105050]